MDESAALGRFIWPGSSAQWAVRSVLESRSEHLVLRWVVAQLEGILKKYEAHSCRKLHKNGLDFRSEGLPSANRPESRDASR